MVRAPSFLVPYLRIFAFSYGVIETYLRQIAVYHNICSYIRGLPCRYPSTDSPRVYTSTNPWKITATFQCVSSTLDEYVALFKKLKESAPPEPKAGSKRTKLEAGHAALVKMLEGRLPTIEAELAVSYAVPAGQPIPMALCLLCESIVC